MRFVVLSLAVLIGSSLATPAGAETKWTNLDSTGTFNFTFHVDGSPVPGVVTYRDSYRSASDGTWYQAVGRTSYTFLSNDGAITGHGVGTFSYRFRQGAAEVGKSTLAINIFDADGLHVGRFRVLNHQTFDANGRITAHFFRLDE